MHVNFQMLPQHEEVKMYEFPTSVQSTADMLPVLTHCGLFVLLGGLFWFAVRKPASKSSDKFRVWLLLSVGSVLVQILAIAAYPSHVQAAIYYELAAMVICMTSGLLEFLRADREGDLKPAVSITETGVIIVIQLVLFALLVPSLEPPRGTTRRTYCKNNLKKIALGMHNYHDSFGRFPSAAALTGSPDSRVPSSWRVSLLPFIEQSNLHAQYDHDQAWDSTVNSPIAARRIDMYLCPSQPISAQSNAASQFFTSYVVPVGEHSVFTPNGKPAHSLDTIPDGTANSLLVMEACGTRIVWTNPTDIDVDSTAAGINLPGSKPSLSSGIMSSHHIAGAQAALADGSVRFISAKTDPAVLKAMLTVDGKERVGEF